MTLFQSRSLPGGKGGGCNVHRPHSGVDNDDAAHSAKRRTGDSPGPRKETNEGQTVTQEGGVPHSPPPRPLCRPDAEH